jgi:hypothetical protein
MGQLYVTGYVPFLWDGRVSASNVLRATAVGRRAAWGRPAHAFK